MHVLFVHQNYPAQFGHIARALQRESDWKCTFVTRGQGAPDDTVRIVRYELAGGATRDTHYMARTFENAVGHALGVYNACQRSQFDRPDLIVGHSGFGSTLFLRELYDCPVINYFEFYYHPHGSDLDFRPDYPPLEREVLRSYCRNAMLLLDLEGCDAGYAPTQWQRSLLPERYRDKVEVIFDGVDLDVWKRSECPSRTIAGHTIPADSPIVTYVARGFESMRGFDLFMETARRILAGNPHVRFVVVGGDEIFYGGDQRFTGGTSFRQFVLERGQYDLAPFIFTGPIPPSELARVFSLSNLHIYLTVPFVLSWSLLDACACGATILASDTAPVRELITHGHTGLLCGFFDVDGLAAQALDVLRDPGAYFHLGQNARQQIEDRYSLEKTLPRLRAFLERVASK